MRKWLVLAAYPAFIAVVLAIVAIADGALDPSDANHAVVIRNEALAPVDIRLLDRGQSTAFFGIPPQTEVTVTPPAALASLREVAALGPGCVATGVVRFGGGIPHWSNLSMLVIGPDGSLGLLFPADLETWRASRRPFPTAEARPITGCVEP